MAPFTPDNFVDNPAGNTPITALKLNNLETAVAAEDITNPASAAGAQAAGYALTSGLDAAVAGYVGASSSTRTALNKVYVGTVERFGALGDGATNDTAAFTAAFAANPLVALTAGKTYMVDTLTLPAGTVLSGYGAILKGRTGTGHVVVATTNCTVLGVTIDGNSSVKTGGTGLSTTTGTNLMVRDVTVQNCIGQGIDIIAITDYSVTGCWVKNVGAQGINMTAANRGRIEGNTVDTALHGIQWWGGDAAASTIIGMEFVAIVGNVVRNVTGGIWGSLGGHISVTGNSVKTCSDVGIDFEGALSCSATGNTVVDCINAGLAVFYGSNEVVFSGNTVTQSAGKGPGFKAFGARINTRISVTGNIFTTVGAEGIYADTAFLGNSIIANNDIYSTGTNGYGIHLKAGTFITVNGNNVNTDQSSAIVSEGSTDCTYNNNTLQHIGTDASAGGTGGGIRVIWISASATGKRSRVRDNVIVGFTTGVNDDCGGDNASMMLVEGNSCDNVYHRGTTAWTGLALTNRTNANPNNAAAIVAF